MPPGNIVYSSLNPHDGDRNRAWGNGSAKAWQDIRPFLSTEIGRTAKELSKLAGTTSAYAREGILYARANKLVVERFVKIQRFYAPTGVYTLRKDAEV